jgi:hypothetical protein
MAQYRCYFLTAKNHIVGQRDIEARDDAEAIIKSRAYCAQETNSQGFEVWRGRHCVYTDPKAKDPSRKP